MILAEATLTLVGILVIAAIIYGIVLISRGQVVGGAILIVLALIIGGGGITIR